MNRLNNQESTKLVAQDKDYDHDSTKYMNLGTRNVKADHNAFPMETWSAFLQRLVTPSCAAHVNRYAVLIGG